MPSKSVTKRARRDLREGKSPSTAAGEFVHEEIKHVREGKHGVRSPEQAIAIGLSKARRAGVPLPPPAKAKAKESTRRSAERDYGKGQSGKRSKPSRRTSRARESVLEREPHSAASPRSLSRQSSAAAGRRSQEQRQTTAKKAVRTKGREGLRQAAQKAALTRAKRTKEA